MKTKLMEKILRCFFILVFALGTASISGGGAMAQEDAQALGNDILYTTDADFDQGTLISVNHDAPYNDQLQLDSQTKPFPFINVAASGRGTVVRTNTETGEIVGEYRTAPEGRGLNPSRTTVDLFGNVWTANRDEVGTIDDIPHGSAVKIGLIVGGTRVDETGSPNPDGGYLAPPFDYNTCVDRNADGLIRTSKGLGDVLDWPDLTDGQGGTDGLVQDAIDECILVYQRLPDAEQTRHVSVDADNNVWVGGYPFVLRMFYKLDGASGAILDSFDAREIGCGGYGGLIDGNGILWSVGGALLRYDPVARTGFCIQQYGYGLGIDTNGYIWMSLWDGGIVKIAPDGTVMPGFPKPTFPSSMITLSQATEEMSTVIAATPQSAPATEALIFQKTARHQSEPKLHPPDRDSSRKGPDSKEIDREPRLKDRPEAEAQALNEPLAGDPSITFWVSPADDWVQSSSPWTPDATISLTIEDGGTVVYTDSQIADADGNFNFNLWDTFDLQRGQTVTVSDGTTTKSHTVMPLYVDTINVGADTISGRGEANTDVYVWVHDNGDLTVISDSSGNWAADFSGQTDLTYFSSGGSAQVDDDGDATGVWWAAPSFRVNPDDDWVESSQSWQPGATITLTVEDGGVVVYSVSQTADDQGNFFFDLWNAFDLQRGQVVTISDGVNTKTHTVMPLFVDGIDPAADTLSGRAQDGTDVHLWVHGDGDLTVSPDGSGNWTADFSAQTDLTSASSGGSEQMDDDGDGTRIWWYSPSFRVSPDDDWVESRQPWPPYANITLTIEDGGSVVYSDTGTADSTGNFHFYLWNIFDLQRGQTVTVTDGTNTKTHTVMDLYVDVINVADDTVSGRAAVGTTLDVWVNGDGELNLTADGSGNWTADFSVMTDITYLSDGSARQLDDDGDATRVDWSGPRIRVAPEDDWVQSWSRWTPGSTVTLSITEDGTEVFSDSQVVDTNGGFNFNLWDLFDLQRGQVVTVSDGVNTKTHIVMPLYVDGTDITADTVFGRADPGTSVDVWVHGDGNLTVTTDGSGNWSADFSDMTDLTYLSDGGSQQFDDDGDVTGVWWSAPRIQVAPEDEWVQSWSRWTPGSTITLTIEDGGSVVYSDSQVVDPHGNFNFNLWDVFDLQRGQVVTVSDGVNTKTHTVMPLYVDDIDFAADTISGRGEAGTSVHVWVHGNGDQYLTVAGDGTWTADFSGQTDLTFASDGGSQQEDADGDATGVWWYSPKIEVSPQENWVQSWTRWTPGTNVTLTIEEGGVEVYSDSQTTDSHGNFHFGLWDIFDVQRGQVVTVSDGTTIKTHTVMPLYVDHVDLAADAVFGRADATRDVEVWVDNDGWMAVTPDGSGNWTADFSGQTDLTYLTNGGSRQVDDDGDTTHVSWTSPRFWVSPDDNWVQSWSSWTPGAIITLTIEEGGAVVYSDTQIADADGYFNFNLWNSGFRLQRGQVVTISDGTTTKTHMVMPLYVDQVDVAADTISGRGDTSADVEIWVHGNGNLYVTPDESGNWSVDFSAQTDLTYLSDGGSRQFDSDGDGTGVWWASPRFQVSPEDEWVQSIRPWMPGATITLTIEDGGVEVYSASQVADEVGNFNFNLWDIFDLQRGQVVTVSDGTNTKTHIVIPLYVDSINVTADTLSGRGNANASVDLWVNGDGSLTVIPDESGNWTADFSGMTDLTYFSDGGLQQADEDGDSTNVGWGTPSIQASPEDNTVNSWNRWTPGTPVTLTVEVDGVVVQTETQTTDIHGNFSFNVWSVDLDTGHQVTVTDGTLTKTHQVNNVNVTDIDVDADQVHGTANPGAPVRVQVYLFNDGSERRVTADASGNWTADFSVGVDGQPAYDITHSTFMNVTELDEDGDSTYRRFGAPRQNNRGVAVTPTDNNVWVANSGVGTVTRLDNDGNVLKVIETGTEPTGVAVDAAGKVWATNMGSNNAVRIDPSSGPDGLGAVDLTVDLGADAWPYNYSDMTGAVVVGSTSPQGFWTVIQDSGTPGFEWGRILWNTEPEASEPPGTEIVVEARAADTEAGLGGQTFQPVLNGELFSMFGQFIEVRVTLKASPDGVSPILSDIRIQPHVIYVDIDIKPGSYPNSINCKNKKEVIPVAVLTTEDFDALTVDYTTVIFEGASEIHVDKSSGLPIQHIEDVDSDGDMDLVFHFKLGDTALTCRSTTGQLAGLTYDGIPVEGTDSVRMISR